MTSKNMATQDRGPRNLMGEILAKVEERYVEEHGEEPPEEFVEEARRRILEEVAQQNRDAHRDIYDALADE